MSRFSYALLLPFLLSACAVGPDYVPLGAGALQVPSAWQGPQAGGADKPADLSSWWMAFHDLALNDLIAKGLEGNLDVKTAEARLTAAQAARTAARADFFPKVTADASASSSDAQGSSRDSYGAGLGLAWVADLFGGTRRGAEAAAASEKAAVLDVASARAALSAEIAQTYFQGLGLAQRLDVAKKNLAAQQETLSFIDLREKAGLAGALEREQAKTSVAQTEAQLPVLARSLSETQNQLALLLGTSPAQAPQFRVATFPAVPDSLFVPVPADVLRQRPDVQAAERRLAAATAATGQATAALYPSLSLNGSLDLTAGALADLASGSTVSRALVGSLAATLFDAGKLRAQVDIKTAAQEEALLAYQSSVLVALQEVENARYAVARLREQQEAQARAAASAKLAAELARAQYQAGAVDYQTVLDTERTRLSAESNLISSQTDYLSALVALYKAMGGGWTGDPA